MFVARELDPQLFGDRQLGVNPVHAREWAARCPSIEDVGLTQRENAQLTGGGEPASITGARITHNLLALLGVEPIRGRGFRADEEQAGHDAVVILSESLWRSRFNADPALVGRTILLDGERHQVVGIVPASFRLPVSGANRRDDVFRPLVLPLDEIGRQMGNYNYFALVRVKPGAIAEQALSEMNVVQASFPKSSGVTTDLRAVLIPLHEFVTGASRARVVDAGGSGRRGPADRVRQSGEPSALARCLAQPRNGDPDRARRQPRPPVPPGAHGECAACRRRRCRSAS